MFGVDFTASTVRTRCRPGSSSWTPVGGRARSCRAERIAANTGFRVESSLVLINVGVTDANNQFVGGLEVEHFQVRADLRWPAL
jgi:hypothetical protein